MNCGGYELRIWAKDESSIDAVIALHTKNLSESSIFKDPFYEGLGDLLTKYSSWKRLPDRIGSDYNRDTDKFETNDRRLYVAQIHIVDRYNILALVVGAAKAAVEAHPEVLAAEWEFEPDGMWDVSGMLFDTCSEGAVFSGIGDASMEDFDNYLRKRDV